VSNIVLSTYTWAVNLRDSVFNALKPEDGQDLVEYAILVGGIAAVAGFALFATPLGDVFAGFRDAITACIQWDDTCGS
jgi:Flp pilus assembly pilin Flp